MDTRALTPEVKTEWLEAAADQRWSTALYITGDLGPSHVGPTGPRCGCVGSLEHDPVSSTEPTPSWATEPECFDRNPPARKRIASP